MHHHPIVERAMKALERAQKPKQPHQLFISDLYTNTGHKIIKATYPEWLTCAKFHFSWFRYFFMAIPCVSEMKDFLIWLDFSVGIEQGKDILWRIRFGIEYNKLDRTTDVKHPCPWEFIPGRVRTVCLWTHTYAYKYIYYLSEQW